MVVNHLNGFVEGTALSFRHLGLVICVTHIQVSVGHHEDVPLLCRIQNHREASRVPAQADGNFALGTGGKFGNRQLHQLLAEIPAGG